MGINKTVVGGDFIHVTLEIALWLQLLVQLHSSGGGGGGGGGMQKYINEKIKDKKQYKIVKYDDIR